MLLEGFMMGDVIVLYQFLDDNYSFCDWSSKYTYENEDKIKPLESLNKEILTSEHPFSLKAVVLGVDGVSDRGYLTPFDKIALLLYFVKEDKKYYETLFCLRLSENYKIEAIIVIDDAREFVDSDYLIQ